MEQFTLSIDFKPNQERLIVCAERDLFMNAIHPQFNDLDLIENRIYFAAYYDKDNLRDVIFFEVLFPELDPEFTKWDRSLFIDSILYYSGTVMEKEPVWITCLTRDILSNYN